MARMLQADVFDSGIANPKFARYRDSDGALWSTVGVAFEAYNVANIANYGIAATEIGATAKYIATDPAPTVLGKFLFIAAAGASLAVADVRDNAQYDDWAGPVDVGASGLPGAAGGLAIVGSAMTLGTDAVNSTSLAASAVIEIAAAIVADIGTVEVTVRSPVLDSGQTVDIVQNGDYYTADGRDLEWSFPEPDFSLLGATATCKIASGTVQSFAGSVAESSGSGSAAYNVTVQIQRAVGDLLEHGTGTFDLFLTLANGHQVPLIAEGTAIIRRRLV